MIQKVYAQAVGTDINNPLGTTFSNLGDIFGWTINVILGVGWALVFVMLALGFIQYIMSQGETKAADKARMWLTYAVIGGVGLFFVTIFRTIIPSLLGAQSGQGPGGNIGF